MTFAYNPLHRIEHLEKLLRFILLSLTIGTFASFLVSDMLTIISTTALIAAVVLSALLGEKGKIPALPLLAWTVSFAVLFLFLIWDSLFGSKSPLDNAFLFLLALIVYQQLNLKTNRDFALLYLFNLMGLLLLSVYAFALSYLGFFLAFLIQSIVLLVLFTFKNNLEKAKLTTYSLDILGSRMINLLVFTALSIMIGNLAIFFAIPRIDFGYFYKDRRLAQNITGFGDKVALGEIGRILEDPTVAFRVEFPDRNTIPLYRLYFKGATYDRYDGKKWFRSETKKRSIESMNAKLTIRSCPDRSKILRQKYFLSPFQTNAVFAVAVPCTFSLEVDPLHRMLIHRFSLRLDSFGDLSFENRREINRIYSVDSVEEEIIAFDNDKGQESAYLDLGSISGKISGLAKEIVGLARTSIEKAERIEGYLLENYRYTLYQEESQEPLEGFLFSTKAGHCEYFASAMALLLRTAGVPTRIAAGYAGGEWNEVGTYLIVRQSDAHSWVEVLTDDGKWKLFDPTPGTAQIFKTKGTFFSHYYDYLKHRWEKYILFYSLRDQMTYASDMKKFSEQGFKWFASSRRDIAETFRSLSFGRGPENGDFIFFIVGLVLVAIIVLLLKRRIRKEVRPPDFYPVLVRLLGRKGFRKRNQETFHEFIKRYDLDRLFPNLERIERIYQRASFGGTMVSKEEKVAILDFFKVLRQNSPGKDRQSNRHL